MTTIFTIHQHQRCENFSFSFHDVCACRYSTLYRNPSLTVFKRQDYGHGAYPVSDSAGEWRRDTKTYVAVSANNPRLLGCQPSSPTVYDYVGLGTLKMKSKSDVSSRQIFPKNCYRAFLLGIQTFWKIFTRYVSVLSLF